MKKSVRSRKKEAVRKQQKEKGPQYVISDRLFHEDHLYRYLEDFISQNHLEQSSRALPFAKEKHEGQVRRGKDHIPFIYHPLLVTCHGIALGWREDEMIAAALLHDVCEDCNVQYEELPVSEEVQEAVRCLTRTYAGNVRTLEEETAYYQRIINNRIATCVKLLDRCNNISSMSSGFTMEGIKRYIDDTETWIYPLILEAEKRYPEDLHQLFVIQYHMKSVMDNMKRELMWHMAK